MSQLAMMACLRLSGPCPDLLWQWKMPLPTRSAPLQLIRSSGLTPARISARPFIGLTVDPGG